MRLAPTISSRLQGDEFQYPVNPKRFQAPNLQAAHHHFDQPTEKKALHGISLESLTPNQSYRCIKFIDTLQPE